MGSKELQTKYNNLKEELSELTVKKAKAEANLDSVSETQSSIKKELKALSGTDNIEEAKKKLDALESKLSVLIEKAEAILDE